MYVSHPAGAAQTLNAAELLIGGLQDPTTVPDPFPAAALTALRGCYEGLRFISYSITPEPPELINFKTQMRAQRFV